MAFPPALTNLMLVQAEPAGLGRYFLAGYAIAVMPAVAVALIDELLGRAALPVRATWCGLVGGLMSLAGYALGHAIDVSTLLQAEACGAVTAFLCTMAFGQWRLAKKAVGPSGDGVATRAETVVEPATELAMADAALTA